VLAAREAAIRLWDRHGVAAEVWSATSWKQLRDDASATERWNRQQVGEPRRSSYLQHALGDGGIPIVAVTDYVSALPDQLARFTNAPFVALGTDGYGFSDTREELRQHFGTDGAGVVTAALDLLGRIARAEQVSDALVTGP